MSELTLTIIRLGLLAGLWFFVLSLAGVLRRDLYGTRVEPKSSLRPRTRGGQRRGGAAGNEPDRIVVTEGSLRGTTLTLKPSGVLVGRNPECALILDDDFASGRHCRVFRDEQGWKVEDLGSTNGTYLGEERLIEVTPVGLGTQLRIGRTVLELRR
ncbi:FHA domain-containing protein [Arsenicicoccus dermatophilus]|uniref:FHA domain-containing protein FhaB/FipA n=1 Tax=Arsenicicoccus dermatophilus TaxID=1076331 RepID=UPI003917333A